MHRCNLIEVLAGEQDEWDEWICLHPTLSAESLRPAVKEQLFLRWDSFCVSVLFRCLSVTTFPHCDKVLPQNTLIFPFYIWFVLMLCISLWNSSLQNSKAALCHLTWTKTEGQHNKEMKRRRHQAPSETPEGNIVSSRNAGITVRTFYVLLVPVWVSSHSLKTWRSSEFVTPNWLYV